MEGDKNLIKGQTVTDSVAHEKLSFTNLDLWEVTLKN